MEKEPFLKEKFEVIRLSWLHSMTDKEKAKHNKHQAYFKLREFV